ncbi:Carbohydrate-selective porin, OprB family [Prochlorococcus marinus str. MIT 1313]|uniref:iron uptake porin n=1 Tax=Prochlorococcus TaxID=1218 RepID=UPI0007B33B01|nr:iron uptake porin [Prochlorococcus marinus]KZR68596.1 Carbohydrate-selective porin, OprB family [Prochlorococcus marinus str. MIT 1313]
MKLFQQLLVAPAALGLMAPMAANAADLDIKGVSDYSASSEQVTSISQFQDVYPTDWAYQALSNLIERYGCVAGYPSGSYLGNRAMTRFEAAALLNACLDRITEVTDELRRLLQEFEQELAILKGRVDGLEARVGELEATQFSTTTKLVGQTSFVIGANSYGGDAKQGMRDAIFDTAAWNANGSPDAFDVDHTHEGSDKRKYGLDGNFRSGKRADKRADEAAAVSGATVFNYDLRLELNTSFTGKDLLKTRLRAGNFGDSPFGSNGYVGLSAMEVAFGESGNPDNVKVDRLWYQFPLGEEFTVTAGAMVRQDNMLAVWPSNYPAETVIDFFTYAGAPGTYNLAKGGGAGIWWDDNDSGWSISASYLSANADDGNPNSGGIATDGAGSNGTAQIAYADERWGAAAAYNYASTDNGVGLYAGNGTPLANDVQALGTTNSFALSAWWAPENTGWMPSVSAGWGINTVTSGDDNVTGLMGLNEDILDSATSQSWYVALQWEDAFVEGNVLGVAGGQPTFVTNLNWDGDFEDAFKHATGKDLDDNAADGNYAFELWYKFQVTDNISVTPAVFYLSRPYGELTDGTINNKGSEDDTFSNFGGLVRTTFKF